MKRFSLLFVLLSFLVVGSALAAGIDAKGPIKGTEVIVSGQAGSNSLKFSNNPSGWNDCVLGDYGIALDSGSLTWCINGEKTPVGTTGVTWGNITGSISAQTDLQQALEAISAGGVTITTTPPTTPGAITLNESTQKLLVKGNLGTYEIATTFTADSAGPTCSGVLTEGADESFEKGTEEFCATGWTSVDTNNVIDTYSTTSPHCGDHSMAVTASSGAPLAKSQVSFTADDNLYYRFYFTAPTLANYVNLDFMTLWSGSQEEFRLRISKFDNDANTHLFVRNSKTASNSTHYFSLVAGTTYYADLHYIRNNSTAGFIMTLHKADGTAVNNEVAGSEISQPSADVGLVNMSFVNSVNSGSVTYYIDDFKLNLSGTDYIGAEACN